MPRPDGKPDQLGLGTLDEPAAKQSDSTVLQLQLRHSSKQSNLPKMEAGTRIHVYIATLYTRESVHLRMMKLAMLSTTLYWVNYDPMTLFCIIYLARRHTTLHPRSLS